MTLPMPAELLEAFRAAAELRLARDVGSQRIAHPIRTATGRRWVGVYEVTPTEVVNLAWSGPAPPAHPRFPAERGLSGAAINTRKTVVSNDVSRDPRYLTALPSTGSELIVPIIVSDRVVGTLDVEDEVTPSGNGGGAATTAPPNEPFPLRGRGRDEPELRQELLRGCGVQAVRLVRRPAHRVAGHRQRDDQVALHPAQEVRPA